ncbi:MAG: hypothetical protein IJZ85_09695 [Lachnospiraceae bacterium]|nr:hypothetical protein [Lachnospiraceae bacterium]
MAIFDHDFFDELTDKLASTGKVISEKAKEVTDSAKTSLQIAQEEKNLRAAYRQLGMYIYEKSGIEADEAMAPYFAAITEAKLNIETLKRADKKAAKPEVWDEDEPEDDDVEEELKEVQPEVVAEETAETAVQTGQEPAERVCPMCKSVVSAQLIYCPKCGEKLK